MNKQSRGRRPSADNFQGQRAEDDIEQDFETRRTQKDAVGGGSPSSGDSGSFGAGRGDAYIDRDLEDVEQEDDSLLAGGRKDVESQPRRGGKSAQGGSDKSRR
ncbi:MAG TPA: hypothetical protein VFH73_07195 [Polyangia bacterium]|jgi:hypothetical protein|nr:hypothetical protein [Polyangia bacterium]